MLDSATKIMTQSSSSYLRFLCQTMSEHASIIVWANSCSPANIILSYTKLDGIWSPLSYELMNNYPSSYTDPQ
jgi:hypothetical protein